MAEVLKTTYKDWEFSGNKKYKIETDAEGLSTIIDKTPYSTAGDNFYAEVINKTNSQVNENTEAIQKKGTVNKIMLGDNSGLLINGSKVAEITQQGYLSIDKDIVVIKDDIVNKLDSTAENQPLSANMGRELRELIVVGAVKYKGSLGVDGTVKTLPQTAVKGNMYWVKNTGEYQPVGKCLKGDIIIGDDTPIWVRIPCGYDGEVQGVNFLEAKDGVKTTTGEAITYSGTIVADFTKVARNSTKRENIAVSGTPEQLTEYRDWDTKKQYGYKLDVIVEGLTTNSLVENLVATDTLQERVATYIDTAENKLTFYFKDNAEIEANSRILLLVTREVE